MFASHPVMDENVFYACKDTHLPPFLSEDLSTRSHQSQNQEFAIYYACSLQRYEKNTCAFDARKWRMAVNARIIWMFTSIAVCERNTLLSIAIPVSVKTYGRYLMVCPLAVFKVTFCDFEGMARLSMITFCVFKVAKCDHNRFIFL